MKPTVTIFLILLILLTPLSIAPPTPAVSLPKQVAPKDVTIQDDAYHPSRLIPRTEWWYFDASLTDNYTFVASVRVTASLHHGIIDTRLDLYQNGQPLTEARVKNHYNQFNASTTTCNVILNNQRVINGTYNATKDAYDYTLDFNIANVTVHLTYTGRTEGWKIMRFQDNNWAVMCPRADVAGTIIYRGITINATGIGYHDHNWGMGARKMIRYGWIWGKINSDHYTLIWSAIMPIRAVDTVIAVENTLDGGYTYIPPENVWFHIEAHTMNHLHHIPTSFFISIQTPEQMSVLHSNAIQLDYSNVLGLVNYWRYHFHNTGTFTFGITSDIVDELAIGEFINFR